jgi:hypothetical protein
MRFVCVWSRPAVSTTAVAARPLDRVIRDGGGIATALAFDELGAGALSPDAELFFRGGAERVRRRDHHGMTVLSQPVGELADRRRLAGAVDADDEHDTRLPRKLDSRRLAEEVRHLDGERLVEVGEIAACLEPSHELSRGGDADVAGDQRLLEPLPGRRLTRVERRCCQLLRERPAAAPERIAQARQEPGALVCRLLVRTSVSEQFSPAACHGGER